MNDLKPINQTKLYGLDRYFYELVKFYQKGNYPNKILFSGQKGIGKSTLAFHFINYVLTLNDYQKYDVQNLTININSAEFKTIQNKSNTNLITVNVNDNKKSIDISQIRDLIINLNKSSFNNMPRFVLIDNIELLNINSINALLKVVEEPNENIFFILINNDKKVLPTLISRCIKYKINLTNKESLNISTQLLDKNLSSLINKDLINYYFTPGNIYHLVKFANEFNYDLSKYDLKSFLKIIIKENLYKKDAFMKNMLFHLIEFYFYKMFLLYPKKIYDEYSYFIKKISNTRTFNLDEEILFLEFEEKILDG